MSARKYEINYTIWTEDYRAPILHRNDDTLIIESSRRDRAIEKAKKEIRKQNSFYWIEGIDIREVKVVK